MPAYCRFLTASGQGKKGFRHGSGYAASKWGLLGFMKSAAIDLGEHKITVNALVPGLIDTAMTRHEKRWTEAVEDYVKNPPSAVSESVSRAGCRLSASANTYPTPETAVAASCVARHGSETS